MTNAAAQTVQNVAYLTHQIEELEARTEWDGPALAGLYARRGTEVVTALRQGVPAATLSEVTGLGA